MSLADIFLVGGGLGFLILVLDIVAILSVLSGRGSALSKLLWTIAILALPVVGMILYFLLGRSEGDAWPTRAATRAATRAEI